LHVINVAKDLDIRVREKKYILFQISLH